MAPTSTNSPPSPGSHAKKSRVICSAHCAGISSSPPPLLPAAGGTPPDPGPTFPTSTPPRPGYRYTRRNPSSCAAPTAQEPLHHLRRPAPSLLRAIPQIPKNHQHMPQHPLPILWPHHLPRHENKLRAGPPLIACIAVLEIHAMGSSTAIPQLAHALLGPGLSPCLEQEAVRAVMMVDFRVAGGPVGAEGEVQGR